MQTSRDSEAINGAKAIADELDKKAWTTDSEFLGGLPPRQRILLGDTLGILQGIHTGRITTSQPRVRDNLVELAEYFSDNPSVNGVDSPSVKELASLAHQVASFGISMDGCAKLHGSPRISRI